MSNDNPISMIRPASNENVSVPAACHPVPVLQCKDENKHDCSVQRVFFGCRPDGKPLGNARCTFSLENGSTEIPCKHILQVPRESQLKHLQAFSRIRNVFPASKPDESIDAKNRTFEHWKMIPKAYSSSTELSDYSTAIKFHGPIAAGLGFDFGA